MQNFGDTSGVGPKLLGRECFPLFVQLNRSGAAAGTGVNNGLAVNNGRGGVVAHARGREGASQTNLPSATLRATMRFWLA